jgi:uncharacterized protein
VASRLLLWLLLGAAAVLLGACHSSHPSARPPGSATTGTTSTASGLRPLSGFGEESFLVEPGGREWCALFAHTEAARERGLMGQTDLRGFDGMLFQFDADTTTGFWMRSTPLPLSIAWFTADGAVVSQTDMAPCGDRADCPTYPPAGPYRYALEVARGGLARLGIGPGSRLLPVASPCQAPARRG